MKHRLRHWFIILISSLLAFQHLGPASDNPLAVSYALIALSVLLLYVAPLKTIRLTWVSTGLLFLISLFYPPTLVLLPSLLFVSSYSPELSVILGLGFLLLATQKLPLLVWIFLSLTAWYLGNYLENTLNLEKQKLALEDAYEGEVRRLRSIYKNSELQFLTREEKAILQERNRIAGEIHDTVGHQLTGAILQLSALEVSGEENALLTDLRERLEQALQDIRQAVHAMHDTSLNIADRLETLAAGYRFCPVHIQVNIQDQPSPSLYYFFVLTAQEALQNTAKHSNADRFDISLRQYGDRYLYLLRDNGSTAQPSTEIYPLKHASCGMGLVSLEERTYSLGGSIKISHENGFQIFIQVPQFLPETQGKAKE